MEVKALHRDSFVPHTLPASFVSSKSCALPFILISNLPRDHAKVLCWSFAEIFLTQIRQLHEYGIASDNRLRALMPCELPEATFLNTILQVVADDLRYEYDTTGKYSQQVPLGEAIASITISLIRYEIYADLLSNGMLSAEPLVIASLWRPQAPHNGSSNIAEDCST